MIPLSLDRSVRMSGSIFFAPSRLDDANEVKPGIFYQIPMILHNKNVGRRLYYRIFSVVSNFHRESLSLVF